MAVVIIVPMLDGIFADCCQMYISVPIRHAVLNRSSLGVSLVQRVPKSPYWLKKDHLTNWAPAAGPETVHFCIVT